MWTPVGSGVEGGGGGVVLALTLYDNALIAGGDFDVAGGIPAPYVARWDGVGCVTSPRRRGADVWKDFPCTRTTSSLAGISPWRAEFRPTTSPGGRSGLDRLGSGLDGKPAALTVVGTDLYVTGLFSTAGGKPSANIAQVARRLA